MLQMAYCSAKEILSLPPPPPYMTLRPELTPGGSGLIAFLDFIAAALLHRPGLVPPLIRLSNSFPPMGSPHSAQRAHWAFLSHQRHNIRNAPGATNHTPIAICMPPSLPPGSREDAHPPFGPWRNQQSCLRPALHDLQARQAGEYPASNQN